MKRFLLLAATLAFAAAGAHGQDKPCNAADSAAAEKAVDMVVGWPQLYETWQRFRHCDKGAVGDLFTDAVLRLTVEWKNVDAFAEAAQRDAQFKAFVHRHLQSPAAKNDKEMVYSRVKKDCPARHGPFCAELADIVHAPALAPMAPMAPMTPMTPIGRSAPAAAEKPAAQSPPTK